MGGQHNKGRCTDPSNWLERPRVQLERPRFKRLLTDDLVFCRDLTGNVTVFAMTPESLRFPLTSRTRAGRGTSLTRCCSLLALSVTAGLSSGCAAEGRLSLDSSYADAGEKSLENRESGGDESTHLSQLRFKETSCNGYDLTPEKEILTISSLKEHLRYRAISFTVTQERDNLHLFDIDVQGEKSQLRVATLKTAREAGRHLHQALLEHGRGYWGIHRSNVAVLAPAGSVDEAAGFALKTGLLCWGVFTQAARDDSFVVPGGYFEL